MENKTVFVLWASESATSKRIVGIFDRLELAQAVKTTHDANVWSDFEYDIQELPMNEELPFGQF